MAKQRDGITGADLMEMRRLFDSQARYQAKIRLDQWIKESEPIDVPDADSLDSEEVRKRKLQILWERLLTETASRFRSRSTI